MKKRILSILLALALLCAILPTAALRASAETTSGTCGDNLTWTYNSSSATLTIQGSGKMNDYNQSSAPWRDKRDSVKKIIIGNSVTTIGYGAFDYCTKLTSVTIGNSVITIGEWAFHECSSLTSVTIGNSVKTIGDGAFCSCGSLKSVTIPNSVKYIEKWAFEECTFLTSVIIPDSVTSIGESAFSDCTALESVTIGNGVTTIARGAFDGCTALKKLTFGNSVKSIGAMAFYKCTALTSLKFPNSLTSIASEAFSGCKSLTSIKVPKGVTSLAYKVFQGCDSLTSATIPDSVTSIDSLAFYRCNPDLVIYGVAGSAAQTYANENDITFVALVAPKITTHPTSASVALGKTASFKVSATGSQLKYQWQYKRAGESSWTNWSGKTSATLTVTAGSNNNGCKYRCLVSNRLDAVYSNAAQLTITNVAPVILTHPSNASCALGKSVTYTVQAAGSGKTYQWQYKRAGETAWTNWSGKTSATLSVTAGSNNNGCRYRCVVKNSYGSVTSNAAQLTITNVAPVIQTHPANAFAAFGKTATFTVVAVGSGKTYQWQYKRAGATSWTNWTDKTSATLTVTAGSNNDGCSYRCLVRNSYGSVYSNAAMLTIVTKPTITTQPSNASCALGKTVTFKVVASGKGLSYQWQYMRSGETSWSNYNGKTSATLTVTAGSNNNGCRYRCVVKNAAGSVTSNAATLTIK